MPGLSSTVRSAVAQTIGLAGVLLMAACQHHSTAWDDAWAECDAHATEQQEFAEPDADQIATWRERYIGACMQAGGFSDPQSIIQ